MKTIGKVSEFSSKHLWLKIQIPSSSVVLPIQVGTNTVPIQYSSVFTKQRTLLAVHFIATLLFMHTSFSGELNLSIKRLLII